MYIRKWSNTVYPWIICEDLDWLQRCLICKRCGCGLSFYAPVSRLPAGTPDSIPATLCVDDGHLYSQFTEEHGMCRIIAGD